MSFHPGAGRYLLEGLILLMVAKIREKKRFQKVFCESIEHRPTKEERDTGNR